jgi:hypothetical protein
MSNGVIITAIICATILLICWMGRKADKKGGGNNGKS